MIRNWKARDWNGSNDKKEGKESPQLSNDYELNKSEIEKTKRWFQLSND
jgi:hypothetical protein